MASFDSTVHVILISFMIFSWFCRFFFQNIYEIFSNDLPLRKNVVKSLAQTFVRWWFFFFWNRVLKLYRKNPYRNVLSITLFLWSIWSNKVVLEHASKTTTQEDYFWPWKWGRYPCSWLFDQNDLVKILITRIN